WSANDKTPMGVWLQQHEQHFVAHAVNAKNVDAVLKDETLRCAADIVRRKGAVYMEGSGITSFEYENVAAPDDSAMSAAIKQEREKIESVWQELIKVDLGPDHVPTMKYPLEGNHPLWEISEKL